MKRLIFIFPILLCLQIFAEETLFSQGNKKYTNGNYSSAITVYDSIISNGLESAEIYYNLGNCYYKKQDWANAIWYYEKSLKLNTNNKSASLNLKVTNLRIIDQIEAIPKLFYKKWWKIFIRSFSIKTWQKLTILSVWIIFITQLLKKLINYQKKYLPAFLNIIALILIITTYSSYYENHSKTEAIIFSAYVNANSAPTDESTNLFSLHSGTKVELIDQIGKWINIKITNGNSGWIRKSDCKIIN